MDKIHGQKERGLKVHINRNWKIWSQIANFIFIKTGQFLVHAACVRHPSWRTEAKLAIVFTYILVQAYLRAPPVVADEAKLVIILVQACLHAPPVLADKAKLAKIAHFAQNSQFGNIFINCSVTIILINAGIFALFPIFQGASYNYHEPNIR